MTGDRLADLLGLVAAAYDRPVTRDGVRARQLALSNLFKEVVGRYPTQEQLERIDPEFTRAANGGN